MGKWKYKRLNDNALMASYAKGNALAFECLYLRHKQALFSFIRRQTNNAAIAEEIAHDAWLAVINCAATYTATASFKTWIFRIAHNRLIDHWRKHTTPNHILFDEVSEQIEGFNDASSEGIELADLLKKLEVLSAEQAETLLLKVEGFTHAEIAEITHTKQETVKSRLRYATQHLRIAMEATV